MLTNFLRQSLRAVWSSVYRFALSLFAALLVIAWNRYDVHLGFVLLAIVIWNCLGFYLKGNETKAFSRMVVDFISVFMAISVSSAPQTVKVMFSLMPLINQHNHSARIKSWKKCFVFFLLWSAVFIYAQAPIESLFGIICYLLFCGLIIAIDWLDSYIKRISDDIERLTSDVLDVADSHSNGTSRLLDQFRNILSGNTMFKSIHELYLVELTKVGLVARAGSRFDPRMRFEVENALNEGVIKERLRVPVIIKPDSVFSGETRNVGFFFERQSCKYLFVVVFVSEGDLGVVTQLFLWQLLNRSVPNVIRLYERRRDERHIQRQMRDDLVKNSQYITSVRAAAHFIRNNINPFVTVSEMLTEYLADENAVTREELANVNRQLKIKQQHIQDYVTRILESPKKDVFAEDVCEVKASTVLKMIISAVEENAEELLDIEYALDCVDLEKVCYKIKRLNFSVLLENLIRNAIKHSDQLPSIKCNLQIAGFKVQISNHVKPACLGFAHQFISDLTSSTKEEIIRRKGEGLLLIRNTCENLGAKLTATLQSGNEEVALVITFGDYHE